MATGYDLKRRLRTNAYTVPTVALNSGTKFQRLYGVKDYTKNSSGLLKGRVTHSSTLSREYLHIPKITSTIGWRQVVRIDGDGFFNHIAGMKTQFNYRITIDGETSLIISPTSSSHFRMLWGDWAYERYTTHPSGYFFYNSDDPVNLLYRMNFLHGSVGFDSQLLIEVQRHRSYSSTHYLNLDYVLWDEIL